jgi:DNA-binding NarL/FixJ family response regulator
MRIILVEDDPIQAELHARDLTREFGGPVKVISTELEFRSRFEELERDPPEIFVIDVWLHWTRPHPGMTLPPNDALEATEAGLRCQRLLADSVATRGVPVILFSVLDDAQQKRAKILDLPPTASYLMKDSDPTPLFQEIRRLTAAKSGASGPYPTR